MKLLNSSISRGSKVAHRVLDGTALIVDLSDTQENKLLTLNSVGTAVWELADGRTASAIVEGICQRFEVKRERAEKDVVDFIRLLARRGLLSIEKTEA